MDTKRQFSKEHKRNLSEAQKGRKCSEETKKKMSIALKGNTNGFKKGKSSWNKGKHLSKEHKNKLSLVHRNKKLSEGHKRNISKSLKGRVIKWSEKISKALEGDKNPAWQGGKSFEPYSPKFNSALKRKIRKRDNYTCQLSGKTEKELGEKLSIHHINYDKKNNKESNLISLSRKWNSKVNFDRLDWMNYFKNKLKNL